MKKRISKRRWKARCRMCVPIPALAMIEHDLQRWFTFEPVGNVNADIMWRAIPWWWPR